MGQNMFCFNKETPVWIYGHGFLGCPLYSRLKENGYYVKGFIDRNADKIRIDHAYEAILPSELEKIHKDEIIVISFQNIREHESVAAMLYKHGLNKIIFLYKDTEHYPQTFDAYNSLVYSEIVEDFEFPFTEWNKDVHKQYYYREYGDYVVTDVPIQMIFSAPLEAPLDVSDSKNGWLYNVAGVYEYKALFDLLLFGKTDSRYFKRYRERLTGAWRQEKEFLADRANVFENYMNEFSNNGMEFFRNSPSHADFDLEGAKFVLSDGHHRACFLAAIKQNYIPLRMTKQDYALWKNSLATEKLQTMLKEMQVQQMQTPVLIPEKQPCMVTTEVNRNLNVSAIYRFFGNMDISQYQVVSLNANLSYYARTFFRLGASKVYAVENRAELVQLSKAINEVEYCDKIEVCEELPKGSYFDIVFCCNEENTQDLKVFSDGINICKKYFVLWLQMNEDADEQKDWIMKEGDFSRCETIHQLLLDGVGMELIVFEKY